MACNKSGSPENLDGIEMDYQSLSSTISNENGNVEEVEPANQNRRPDACENPRRVQGPEFAEIDRFLASQPHRIDQLEEFDRNLEENQRRGVRDPIPEEALNASYGDLTDEYLYEPSSDQITYRLPAMDLVLGHPDRVKRSFNRFDNVHYRDDSIREANRPRTAEERRVLNLQKFEEKFKKRNPFFASAVGCLPNDMVQRTNTKKTSLPEEFNQIYMHAERIRNAQKELPRAEAELDRSLEGIDFGLLAGNQHNAAILQAGLEGEVQPQGSKIRRKVKGVRRRKADVQIIPGSQNLQPGNFATESPPRPEILAGQRSRSNNSPNNSSQQLSSINNLEDQYSELSSYIHEFNIPKIIVRSPTRSPQPVRFRNKSHRQLRPHNDAEHVRRQSSHRANKTVGQQRQRNRKNCLRINRTHHVLPPKSPNDAELIRIRSPPRAEKIADQQRQRSRSNSRELNRTHNVIRSPSRSPQHAPIRNISHQQMNQPVSPEQEHDAELVRIQSPHRADRTADQQRQRSRSNSRELNRTHNVIRSPSRSPQHAPIKNTSHQQQNDAELKRIQSPHRANRTVGQERQRNRNNYLRINRTHDVRPSRSPHIPIRNISHQQMNQPVGPEQENDAEHVRIRSRHRANRTVGQERQRNRNNYLRINRTHDVRPSRSPHIPIRNINHQQINQPVGPEQEHDAEYVRIRSPHRADRTADQQRKRSRSNSRELNRTYNVIRSSSRSPQHAPIRNVSHQQMNQPVGPEQENDAEHVRIRSRHRANRTVGQERQRNRNNCLRINRTHDVRPSRSPHIPIRNISHQQMNQPVGPEQEHANDAERVRIRSRHRANRTVGQERQRNRNNCLRINRTHDVRPSRSPHIPIRNISHQQMNQPVGPEQEFVNDNDISQISFNPSIHSTALELILPNEINERNQARSVSRSPHSNRHTNHSRSRVPNARVNETYVIPNYQAGSVNTGEQEILSSNAQSSVHSSIANVPARSVSRSPHSNRHINNLQNRVPNARMNETYVIPNYQAGSVNTGQQEILSSNAQSSVHSSIPNQTARSRVPNAQMNETYVIPNYPVESVNTGEQVSLPSNAQSSVHSSIPNVPARSVSRSHHSNRHTNHSRNRVPNAQMNETYVIPNYPVGSVNTGEQGSLSSNAQISVHSSIPNQTASSANRSRNSGRHTNDSQSRGSNMSNSLIQNSIRNQTSLQYKQNSTIRLESIGSPRRDNQPVNNTQRRPPNEQGDIPIQIPIVRPGRLINPRNLLQVPRIRIDNGIPAEPPILINNRIPAEPPSPPSSDSGSSGHRRREPPRRAPQNRPPRGPPSPPDSCSGGACRRPQLPKEKPKLPPRPWMSNEKSKKKKDFRLTDEQKVLVLDNYYPGLIHDAVNQRADFNEVAKKFVTPETAVDGNKAEKGMSLLEAFDTRVKYEQITLKSILTIAPKGADPILAYKPVYGPLAHPVISDIVLEENVRASAIPVDLQHYIRKTPESDPVRAISCLSRAQRLNDYYKEYKAAQTAANLAPPDKIEQAALHGVKTFQIDSLSSETKTVHSEFYKALELVSYIGITKPN